MIKVLILGLFAAAGLVFMDPEHIFPLLNKGIDGVLMGAALIFVAYEGFELIPNAVNEMKNPARELPRGIVWAIIITAFIYFVVSLVAVGNLTPEDITKYKEYALAVAAKPFLGQAGFTLIGLGALLSTASAINATLFGTARLGMIMAREKDLPKVFSHKERTKDIPYVSLIFITVVTLIFVNTADLTIISSFASSTFLLTFVSINTAAMRLRALIGINPLIPLIGLFLSGASWLVLFVYLWQTNFKALSWIGGFYLAVMAAELMFSKRRLVFKKV